ncbi:Bacillus/Clostridium GerA spore germination protein [Bacillus subtilis]|nr:Bacillus/Clostridium GerA spore germination protein [Bacillus subtilis]SCV44087.1 FIG01231462: hypothetical protein [Bacillus subtilis]
MRLPKTVGQTVSILGALVIGTAAEAENCVCPHGDCRILDRSDLIIAPLWIPIIMVKIAGSLYIVVYGLSFLHSKIDLKAMYTPTGMFSLVCSFWFFLNTNQLIDFNRIKPIINKVISFLLPLFIYLIIKSKAMFGAKAKR